MPELFAFPDPVDETSARLVAGGVLALATATVVLDEPRLLLPLTYGFAARVASGPRFSPLGQLATRVVRPRLPVEPRPTPGPPKRLAQGMGLTMSATALTLHYRFGKTRAAYAVLGALIGAAGLESVAGICLACRLFPLLMRWGLVPEEACRACADLSTRRSTTLAADDA